MWANLHDKAVRALFYSCSCSINFKSFQNNKLYHLGKKHTKIRGQPYIRKRFLGQPSIKAILTGSLALRPILIRKGQPILVFLPEKPHEQRSRLQSMTSKRVGPNWATEHDSNSAFQILSWTTLPYALF